VRGFAIIAHVSAPHIWKLCVMTKRKFGLLFRVLILLIGYTAIVGSEPNWVTKKRKKDS
jgi:hypothetical protein